VITRAAYLEIIAVQPGKALRSKAALVRPGPKPCATRCARGPRLLHFVASVPDVRRRMVAR
jgi:hypothetical protein